MSLFGFPVLGMEGVSVTRDQGSPLRNARASESHAGALRLHRLHDNAERNIAEAQLRFPAPSTTLVPTLKEGER
jgi:hypothetical protein